MLRWLLPFIVVAVSVSGQMLEPEPHRYLTPTSSGVQTAHAHTSVIFSVSETLRWRGVSGWSASLGPLTAVLMQLDESLNPLAEVFTTCPLVFGTDTPSDSNGPVYGYYGPTRLAVLATAETVLGACWSELDIELVPGTYELRATLPPGVSHQNTTGASSTLASLTYMSGAHYSSEAPDERVIDADVYWSIGPIVVPPSTWVLPAPADATELAIEPIYGTKIWVPFVLPRAGRVRAIHVHLAQRETADPQYATMLQVAISQSIGLTVWPVGFMQRIQGQQTHFTFDGQRGTDDFVGSALISKTGIRLDAGTWWISLTTNQARLTLAKAPAPFTHDDVTYTSGKIQDASVDRPGVAGWLGVSVEMKWIDPPAGNPGASSSTGGARDSSSSTGGMHTPEQPDAEGAFCYLAE